MGPSHLRLAVLLAALPALVGASAPPAGSLHLSIEGLRNQKGAVMLCLTQRDAFLTCADDPRHLSRTVSAAAARTVELDGVPAGNWSLLLIHDENRNGKLDTMMGMPREGFGFSRNPAIRLGPPSLRDVRFTIPQDGASQAIRVKYLL